jgi:hypothetical protein
MTHVLEPSLLSPLSDLENLAGEHACSSSFPVSQKAEERLAMTLFAGSKHQNRGLGGSDPRRCIKAYPLRFFFSSIIFLHYILLSEEPEPRSWWCLALLRSSQESKKVNSLIHVFGHSFLRHLTPKYASPTHMCSASSPRLFYRKKQDHKNDLCSGRSVLRLSNLTIYLAYPKPRLLDRMPSASPPPFFSGIQINDEEEQCSGSCSSDFQKSTQQHHMSWDLPAIR